MGTVIAQLLAMAILPQVVKLIGGFPMKKALNPKVHGILDYGLAALFLLAPSLFGFTETAATVSYAIGVLYIATSLLTKYPLGAIKLIPFPAHGVLESVMAVAWIIFPWVFGFAGDAAARNFFIVAGVGLLVVAALTDYTGVYVEHKRHAPRHA